MNNQHIIQVAKIFVALGIPLKQRDEMAAHCLLALLNLGPETKWADAQNPLLDTTGILNWIWENYKAYPPSTRARLRQTMRKLVAAGLARQNPDKPDRHVRAAALYQIDPTAFELLRAYHPRLWRSEVAAYLAARNRVTPSGSSSPSQSR